jgi:hypothetical protein
MAGSQPGAEYTANQIGAFFREHDLAEVRFKSGLKPPAPARFCQLSARMPFVTLLSFFGTADSQKLMHKIHRLTHN